MKMEDFYDKPAPYYHLVFEDWEASLGWQAVYVKGRAKVLDNMKRSVS
jgi:hypothetical protein